MSIISNEANIYTCLHLDHKTSLKSHGYICRNSQQYIVLVKIIDFNFMSKIIRIAKDFFWTTFKVFFFSIFKFFYTLHFESMEWLLVCSKWLLGCGYDEDLRSLPIGCLIRSQMSVCECERKASKGLHVCVSVKVTVERDGMFVNLNFSM